MKPLGKTKIRWSRNFAYAIGLLTTDGNLSSDKRHINFTSKDLELINKFQKSLGINNNIGRKSSGSQKLKKYYFVCISDILFYKFLLTIGLMPKKSKILKGIKIPDKYFFDFLRGHFDGDGTFYSYWDPRWKSSFMFYTVFVSASKNHIKWLQNTISKFLKIKGHITKSSTEICYQLKYAKNDSLKILRKMYYSKNVICLKRKRLKVGKVLSIIGIGL